MTDFWNQRYGEQAFAYGKQPNVFFKQQLDILDSGSILFPAEGEGRNAVYAASQGWNVMAFDTSEKGKEKALQLAQEQKVAITYTITDVMQFHSDTAFDVIALCYAHFPASIRKQAHKHLLQFLKPNGIVVFEAFAKAQLGNASGGPKNIEMLFSIDEVKEEFTNLDFSYLEEKTVTLKEGNYHQGTAEVIRFVGKKL
ncbi:bifunctional 2-polyprenyl-6-hydroxyphenol methylase/3-demethylubiquinol 3-O-methyltransferase UbiG [Mesonia sp. HuA40]|uniref:class I SAM-dependent methyltransferase n=1 Tax=Mesonia sp. HuA40 TaxID=2602761 RepID=UPI0011C70A4F|nr:class I SAM-dependent methyltransferase [Mesonia sp. HuA40]TXK73612.1 class I SAM-dependent methyltransferase [Mesonia sp. HuA40]